MSWKDKWSHRDYERPKRPARRRLDSTERDALLAEVRRAIAKTAVLPALGVRVVAERGFLHFDRPAATDPQQWQGMARALPRAEGGLLLEAQSSRGGYFEVKKGSTAVVVRAIAEGAAGTFHGVGAVERRARLTKRGLDREPMVQTAEGFVYASDGTPASVPEVLYHHFELPLDAAGEPRDWYAYHRRPAIREIAAGRVLVGFSADSFSGRHFESTCLYANRDGAWAAYPVRPNAADTIAAAEAWLVKRKWEAWG
jgi:hypothetical protein